jgi:hypothetical protein
MNERGFTAIKGVINIMRRSFSGLSVVGILLIIAGAVGSAGLHYWLAFTDSEYAKHDESLYATIRFFTHGGWLPTILIIVGMLLYIIYKDD